jgi:hypothetical protein
MKITFGTTLFYVISTTPEFAEYLNLPLLKTVEAQAWGTIILSSGLVANGIRAKRLQKTEVVEELNEKVAAVEEKKSE